MSRDASEIPQGLMMAMAKNPETLKAFSAMEDSARQEMIDRAREVTGKKEMQTLISDYLSTH